MPRDIAGVDLSFVAEQRAKAEERRRRFEAEARRPPPIPQPKVMAHPGGKIVKSDAREKLVSLIERLRSEGRAPTQAQLDALRRMSSPSSSFSSSPPAAATATDSDSADTENVPSPKAARQHKQQQQKQKQQQQHKEMKRRPPQPPLSPRGVFKSHWSSRTSACRAFFRHLLQFNDVPLSKKGRAFLAKQARLLHAQKARRTEL